VARSAGVVAESKLFLYCSYHPSQDAPRDPASLLIQEGTSLTLTSNQTTTTAFRRYFQSRETC